MNKGRRHSTNLHNKERINAVMDILEELDRVATEIIKWSYDNQKSLKKEEVKELAEKFTKMPIAELEVSVLWAKLNDFQGRLNNIRKENGDRESTQEGDNI